MVTFTVSFLSTVFLQVAFSALLFCPFLLGVFFTCLVTLAI